MTMKRTYRQGRSSASPVAIFGSALLLLVMACVGASAQATLEPHSVNSGGDTRTGAFGAFFSTIGEPFATDSVSVSDDQSTWTGFWQVVPILPLSGVEIEARDLRSAERGMTSVTPNPFNTELDIEIDVPNSGLVDLAAFDLTGRRVETLLQGEHERTGLRLRWRPDGLAPGTYFLILTIDGARFPARVVNYYR